MGQSQIRMISSHINYLHDLSHDGAPQLMLNYEHENSDVTLQKKKKLATFLSGIGKKDSPDNSAEQFGTS